MKKIALIITMAIAALSIESCCGPCETIESGQKVYKYEKGDIVNVAGRKFIVSYNGAGLHDKCEDVNEKTYKCSPWQPADGDSHWFSESVLDKYNEDNTSPAVTEPAVDTIASDSTYY